MTADRILAAMLALAPHDNPARMQPIAETIERVASGPSEEAMLLALWIEGGPHWENPFQLRIVTHRLAVADWLASGRWGVALDWDATYAVRLFRGAFRACPDGAQTTTAAQLAYYQGRARCVPTLWDRTVASRVYTLRPLLAGQ